MNQIEFQRLVIREEMYESQREKIIDLSLQIARRPKGKPTGKWIDKEAVRRD
jgi:hypothetical protein